MSNAPAKAVCASLKEPGDTPPVKKESIPNLPSPTPSVELPVNRRFVRDYGDDDDDRNRNRDSKRKRSHSPQQDRETLTSPSPRKSRNINDRGTGGRRRGYGTGHQPYSGGRCTYAYERPHASPWYQNDWESYSGGGNRAEAGVKSHGLMSFKQFIQHLEDDIQPFVAVRRYNEYRCDYVSEQKKSFFELHKEEEWLKDKHHPANLLDIIERRNYHAGKAAHDFLLALRVDTLIIDPGAHAFMKKLDLTKKSNPVDESNGGRGLWFKKHAPKAHPISSEPRRVLIDTEQAQALLRKLDSEKGIEENILGRPWEGDSNGSSDPVIIIKYSNFLDRHIKGTQLLDTLTSYLWSIHGLDYYGMFEKTEPKGLRHVRSEASDVTSSNGAEWEKSLDSHWKKRLDCQDPLALMAVTVKGKIGAAADQALDQFIRKIKDEKYDWMFVCGVEGCLKIFIAREYVVQHLNRKHPELVMELTSKIQEDLYLENYMTDPNAPGSKFVMQKTMQQQDGLNDNRKVDQLSSKRLDS